VEEEEAISCFALSNGNKDIFPFRNDRNDYSNHRTPTYFVIFFHRSCSSAQPRGSPKGTWDANLRYTPEPSTALRGYLVAVMVDDDNAPLARSAGAEVLPLHEEAPTSPSQAAFESWWEACVLRARADGLAVAVVASSSKRCKHLHDWLKRDGTVRFTNAKNLAKAITFNNGEGDLLLDVDKGVIEKVGRAAGPGGIKEVGPPSAPAMAAAPSAKAPEDAVETSKKPDANEAYFPPNDDDDNDEMPVSTGRKRPQEEESGNNAEQSGGDQQPPDRQKRRRKNRDEGALAEEVDRAEEEVSVAEPVASETSSAAANNQERKVVDESSDDEPGLPAERMPLPTTEDGWLVAAPKRRKAFRKDRDEDFVADEDVPGSAAETERISGLIVRDYVPPNGVSRGGGATVGRANRKKKDFKRCKIACCCCKPAFVVAICNSCYKANSCLFLSSFKRLKFAKITSCWDIPRSTPMEAPVKITATYPKSI